MAKELSAVETELRTATGLKPKFAEKRQDFLSRLAAKGQEIDQDAWDNLSQPAQLWVNAAIKAMNAEKDIRDFNAGAAEPEEEEEEQAGDEPADEGEEQEEQEEAQPEAAKPAKGNGNGKPKGKPAAKSTGKPAKAAPKAAAAKPKGKPAAAPTAAPAAKAKGKPAAKAAANGSGEAGVAGVKVQIKRLVLNDPKVSVDTIMETLQRGGLVPSKLTVSGIRAEFRHSLKFLRDEGALKRDIII